MKNSIWHSFIDNQFVRLAIVLAFALIITALIAAGTALKFKDQKNTVYVSGVAKAVVEADSAFLPLTLSPNSEDGDTAKKLETDTATIKAFLAKNNVPDEEITIDPVITIDSYEGDTESTRTISIRTSRVSEIASLAEALSALPEQNVDVRVGAPEYYYTKIPELQISLSGQALENAHAQAEAIAGQSGHSLGRLQSSSSRDAMVQIPSTSTYSYSSTASEINSVKKEIVVIVDATFYLK